MKKKQIKVTITSLLMADEPSYLFLAITSEPSKMHLTFASFLLAKLFTKSDFLRLMSTLFAEIGFRCEVVFKFIQ